MPVKMIGDILSAQLPHMQPYIRFCSCQLNGAALIQQKTDEAPDFKEFVKVRKPGLQGDPGNSPERRLDVLWFIKSHKCLSTKGLWGWMEVRNGIELARVVLTAGECLDRRAILESLEIAPGVCSPGVYSIFEGQCLIYFPGPCRQGPPSVSIPSFLPASGFHAQREHTGSL